MDGDLPVFADGDLRHDLAQVHVADGFQCLHVDDLVGVHLHVPVDFGELGSTLPPNLLRPGKVLRAYDGPLGTLVVVVLFRLECAQLPLQKVRNAVAVIHMVAAVDGIIQNAAQRAAFPRVVMLLLTKVVPIRVVQFSIRYASRTAGISAIVSPPCSIPRKPHC